jgi:hypothetical protein
MEMRRERINIGMRIGLECAGCVEKKGDDRTFVE